MIVLRHALKNAVIPIIGLIGLPRPPDTPLGDHRGDPPAPRRRPFFFGALNKLDYPVVQSVNLIGHILPNVLPTIIVVTTTGLST